MNSQELVYKYAGLKRFGNVDIQISAEQVYLAATEAQYEILTELYILESVGTLALTAGQERYEFSPRKITGVYHEVIDDKYYQVIDVPGHKFHKGDTILIYDVQGVDINGRKVVEKVAGEQIYVEYAGGEWTGGGTVDHILSSAIRIKGDMRILSGGIIERSDIHLVNKYRDYVRELVRYYEILSNPLIVGFQAVPSGDVVVEFVFYRKPLPFENISETVNPIIPDEYRRIFFLGTYYNLLSSMSEPAVKEERDRITIEYEREKLDVRRRSIYRSPFTDDTMIMRIS